MASAKQSKLGWQYNCDTESGITIHSSPCNTLYTLCTKAISDINGMYAVASWRLYLLSNITTHASSCRSMLCHALSETKAHQTPSLGIIAHLHGYCNTLKRNGWSMFRLPASMCTSLPPTEQEFVAIRNKPIGVCVVDWRASWWLIQYDFNLPTLYFVHQYPQP